MRRQGSDTDCFFSYIHTGFFFSTPNSLFLLFSDFQDGVSAISICAHDVKGKINGHIFQSHNYFIPTWCEHCGKLLVGLIRQVCFPYLIYIYIYIYKSWACWAPRSWNFSLQGIVQFLVANCLLIMWQIDRLKKRISLPIQKRDGLWCFRVVGVRLSFYCIGGGQKGWGRKWIFILLFFI